MRLASLELTVPRACKVPFERIGPQFRARPAVRDAKAPEVRDAAAAVGSSTGESGERVRDRSGRKVDVGGRGGRSAARPIRSPIHEDETFAS
jgi:hypothetical protein